MKKPRAAGIAQLRGLAQLLTDGASGITDVVEAMHGTVQRVPGPISRRRSVRARGLAAAVYASVRGGIRAGGWLFEQTLVLAERAAEPGPTQRVRDGALANLVSVINGLWGDHLHATHNPLALPMQCLIEGTAWRPGIDPWPAGCADRVRRDVLLCVHGLCLNESHWHRDGESHGEAIARETGWQLVHLRYNTGRSIADNGRDLSTQLEALVRAWPRQPVRLHVLAHSMGGLVARAALHAATDAQTWPAHLCHLMLLGTPHLGAPLERLGHGFERALGLSPYSAPFVRLGASRSAGITDLREGRFAPGLANAGALPRDFATYAVAGCLGTTGSSSGRRIRAQVLGDGLVPVPSALGRHARRDLKIPASRRLVVEECGHLQLLGDARVRAQLLQWMQESP